MTDKRKIEIFSAACSVCDEIVARIRDLACPSCEVIILDINDTSIAQRAKDLGVRSVPAIAINGKLADCCSARGPDQAILLAAGVGQPLP